MDTEFDSDDDSPAPEYETTREGIIFCIDASDEMLGGEDENDLCYLQRCFKCARDRMLDNIMVSDKEFVGIALLGVQATAAPIPTTNGAGPSTATAAADVAILFDVSRPGADILKKLDAYIKSTAADFKTSFRREFIPIPCSLAEALWFCQSMLSLANTKFGAKDLLLMTCDDKANMDVASRRQACKRAEALMQVGVALRLLYLGDVFNIDAFYKELLVAAHPWSSGDFESGDEKLLAMNVDEMPEAALTRSSYNRHLFRLDLTLAKDTTITVIMYTLFRLKTTYEKKKIVKLDQRSNVQVRSNLARFDETGDLVSSSQLFKGVKIGERSAIFSTAELHFVRNMYPVGFTLLGFKPISEVRLEDYVKTGMFLQPDDSAREGSSAVFFSLLQRCLDRQVIPLCRIVLKHGCAGRLVYFLPQCRGSEELGALGVPGFHMLHAPFAGECRAVGPEQTECTSSEEQQELARAIIKKLKVNYQPSQFHNPEVRTYFAAVEALALEYEEPEEVEDSVEPDVESIDARIGPLAQQFLASVAKSVSIKDDDTSSQVSSQSSRGAKRGRGRGRGSNAMDIDNDGTSSQTSSNSQSSMRGRGRGRGRGRATMDVDD